VGTGSKNEDVKKALSIEGFSLCVGFKRKIKRKYKSLEDKKRDLTLLALE